MSTTTEERRPKQVAAFVDDHLRDEFLELARLNERSASAELRVAMRQHLEREGSRDRSSASDG